MERQGNRAQEVEREWPVEEEVEERMKVTATETTMETWRTSRRWLEVDLMFELRQTEELPAAQSPSDTSTISMATL